MTALDEQVYAYLQANGLTIIPHLRELFPSVDIIALCKTVAQYQADTIHALILVKTQQLEVQL